MNSPKLLICTLAAAAAGFAYAQGATTGATPATTPSTATDRTQGQVNPTPAPANSTMERTDREAAVTGSPARNADGSLRTSTEGRTIGTERTPRADRN